jgi:hypothetical protein
MGGFVVFGIGSVVSDLRVGEHHDLPGVRRICEDFLVARERGIKNYFPVTFAFRAVASAAEDSSIFQRKDCLHWISGGVDFINFIRAQVSSGEQLCG